jgi:hypothetical protein
MSVVNTRPEIIALLRGFVACSLLSHLDGLGLIPRMLEKPFRRNDFDAVANQQVLEHAFVYLSSIGLLGTTATDESSYAVTPLGRKILDRAGAFTLLSSYQEYFSNIDRLLSSKKPPAALVQVDRHRNVVGSGELHSKKYFKKALQLIAGRSYDLFIDIGCGNGEFLNSAMSAHLSAAALAVDLAEVAVTSTLRRLKSAFPHSIVEGIVANGLDIPSWMKKVPEHKGALITAWFVIHEFANSEADKVIAYFQALKKAFPHASVMVGELVCLDKESLALNKSETIMPEYLFFHALSGQGVLSWDSWQTVLASIPYKLTAELNIDLIDNGGGQQLPSSFIWYLEPFA